MRRANRARIAIAASLAAAAVVAACGNDEANEYVDEINGLQTDLTAQVNEIASATPPGDPKAFAETSVALQETFANAADEFEAVEPPEEIAAEHDRMVQVIRDVGEQMGEAETGLASGNPQKAEQAAAQLQSASTELSTQLDAIINEINAKLE